jgi:hypothetical protein
MEKTTMRKPSPVYTDLCNIANIADADLFEAEASRIARDPAVRTLRLWLYARRNRAKATRKLPPILYRPPPPRRSQCRPRRAASSNDGEATDAR